MNLRFFLTASSLAALVGSTVVAFAANTDSQYHVIKKTPIGGDGFWDYLTIDSASRRLYIGRGDRVIVIDLDTDKLVGEIPGMAGVHGIAIVPELKRGFITCGKDNSVRVFDTHTLKETATLKGGSKPDAILFDPSSKKIFAFDNGGTTATIIDPANVKVKDSVELGGAPESGVSDGEGHVYVNLEDKSEIVEIDAKKMSATKHWSLSPGTEPTGLAMDRKHRRLFSGCHNNMMVIMDADSGKVITTLPIGAHVDCTVFDPETQNAFSSNGDGTLTVIHEESPDSFKVIQNVETQQGARTMAMDSKTRTIRLATATTVDAPAGSTTQNKRHKSIVPGSFTVLTVGK